MRNSRSLFLVCITLFARFCFPLLASAQQTTPATNPVISTPTAAGLLPTATAVVLASITEQRTYTIREGDTLLSVAVEVGVDINDMGCLLLPTFDFHQPLVIGTLLIVPPPTVLCHRVVAGETVQSIADFYETEPAAILAETWNEFGLNQSTLDLLLPGRFLRVPLVKVRCGVHQNNCAQPAINLPVPQTTQTQSEFLPMLLNQEVNSSPLAALGQGGVAPYRTYDVVPANWPYGSGHFDWPLSGWLTQSYRYDHRAIDIAANLGTPVAAADRGVVIRAGWNEQGYGFFVVIDHNIDSVTLYGHLSRVFVNEGDVVARGQLIGAVGSTGNSTGPHLHFEIRDFGRLINPLELLGR